MFYPSISNSVNVNKLFPPMLIENGLTILKLEEEEEESSDEIEDLKKQQREKKEDLRKKYKKQIFEDEEGDN